MANQPVKFRKGVSTSLPKTPTNETVGAFLLETDTGNLYVDDSSTSRVKVKDNTKLPLSGGELTGPIKFNANSLPQKTLKYITGIDGFAEGGQLGWQSKEEFLSGYSEKGHTHLYAGSTTAGGAANSANKLSTGRKISLGNAVKSTATTFDGSSDITIPINSVGEAFLGWGGKNIVEGFSPIDASLVPTLGANRMAFSKPEGITIEYSRDAGATWIDYEASDADKIALFTETPYTSGFVIGKSTSGDNCATKDCLLRIIYDTYKAGLYTILLKFIIYVSTNGSEDCWVTIETATNANPNTWTTRVNKQPIAGWSGWNVINTAGFFTYYKQCQFIKFTFGCDTTGESETHGGLNIQKIYGYGGVGWVTPSNLAKQGRMYSIGIDQSVAFPNYVASNTPNTENPTVSQFLVTNGTDNYFRKASLAHVKKSLGIDIQSLINTLDVSTSDPIDDNYYIAQDASGTTRYYKRKHSSLYNYIKSKTDKLYASKEHNHDARYIGVTDSRVANTVLAAPDGTAGGANFRKLTMNDIPKNYFHYDTSQQYKKGYYKIRIKSLLNWMLSIHVRVYQNYQNTDLVISGYNYIDHKDHWFSPKATILGSSLDSIQIVFGYDTDDYLWFTIPAKDYTAIDIVSITNSFGKIINFNNLFEISYTETEPTTVQARVTAYRPYLKSDFSLSDINNKASVTHTHGNITNDGKVGNAASKVLTTSTGGTIVASDEGTAFNKNFETSTSNIKSNGTSASVGTSTNIARADHVHPTDTTRASAEALGKHMSNTIAHITDVERTTWNAKQNALKAGTDYLTPASISSTYLKKNPDGTNNLIGTDNKINSVYLPTYTSSSVGLGNVTNDKQVKGLSTGTTENHIVTWGANGYTVKDSGYTIATSVPPDAKFTDSTLVVGSKNTSSTNEAVSSNSIYLNLFNGTTCANSHNIVGTGATTVSSDANGKITINTPSVTIPTALPNPQILTIQGNGTTSFTYNGSASKTLNIKSGANVSVSSDTSGNITISATNTDTKVTSVSNHYTPTGTTTLSASGATATEITNSSNIQVVTGITMDDKGHTTSVKSIGLKIPEIPEIPTTLPNDNPLTIQINSGAVEGTDIFTYDGKEDKSINIKQGKYITITPNGDGNITIEGNYKSATSEESGLVKLANILGDSEDTAVTQHIVKSKVDELDTRIEALDTKIDETTQSLDISDYVRCANKVIETGYVDNTYTQVIDNNKISFNQGDTTIASIHDNKIESENVVVHNSINIGDEDSGIFEILVDSTNGLIIR